MVALRDVKKAEVERYFETIRDQICTFSQNQMVIDATREFRVLFRQYRQDCELSKEELERMRRELLSYYTGDFSQEYQKQNDPENHSIIASFRNPEAGGLDTEPAKLSFPEYANSSRHSSAARCAAVRTISNSSRAGVSRTRTLAP